MLDINICFQRISTFFTSNAESYGRNVERNVEWNAVCIFPRSSLMTFPRLCFYDLANKKAAKKESIMHWFNALFTDSA